MSNWGLRLLSGLSLDNTLLGNWIRSGVSHSPATATTTFPANLTVGGTITCSNIVASTETISSSETNAGSLAVTGTLQPGLIASNQAFPTTASANQGLMIFYRNNRPTLLACGSGAGLDIYYQSPLSAPNSLASINFNGLQLSGGLLLDRQSINTAGTYAIGTSPCCIISVSSGTVNLSIGTTYSSCVMIRNLTNTATITLTGTLYPYNSGSSVSSITLSTVNSTCFVQRSAGAWVEMFRF